MVRVHSEMQIPRVTIVMPVCNGGHYFRLALQSAIAQTYGNLEIVVVNDGSTDRGETESIALEHASRIRYIRQENKGVAGALNTAIGAMTGDFFAWLSHDDIHLPHKTARQVAYHRRLGRPDSILFSDYELIDADGNPIGEVKQPHKTFLATPMLPLMNGYINGCTIFIPTAIIRAFGPFNESLRHTQDYNLWNKMLSQHEFFHQPETLVRYRVHPGQDSHKAGAAAEGDTLWIHMLESRSETERVQLYGSQRRYFASLAEFLEHTPYKEAAAYARTQVPACLPQTMVSVILPFRNEIQKTRRAVESVLAQTHLNFELILIDDGSTDDTTEIAALARGNVSVRLIRQTSAGPAAARNRGLCEARGEYIAFVEPEDRFVPQKLQRQLGIMQSLGKVFSHTSYHVEYPGRAPDIGVVNSGRFTGLVYPTIISECPIALSTVMLHRIIVAEGFMFSEEVNSGEGVLNWIEIAARHELLGIDEPLSFIEWSDRSVAVNATERVTMLCSLINSLEGHAVHKRHDAEIAELRRAIHELASIRKPGLPARSDPCGAIARAFGGTA